MKHVLHISKGVSDKLQTKDLNVVSGYDRITDLLSSVKELRQEKKFEEFLELAVKRSNDMGISLPKEGRSRKLPRRIDDNPDTAVILTAKDKYRVTFYYEVRYFINNTMQTLL